MPINPELEKLIAEKERHLKNWDVKVNYKQGLKADQWFPPKAFPKRKTDEKYMMVVPYKGRRSPKEICDMCGWCMGNHGYLEDFDGPVVCPGDWIIYDDEYFIELVNNEAFKENYERVND